MSLTAPRVGGVHRFIRRPFRQPVCGRIGGCAERRSPHPVVIGLETGQGALGKGTVLHLDPQRHLPPDVEIRPRLASRSAHFVVGQQQRGGHRPGRHAVPAVVRARSAKSCLEIAVPAWTAVEGALTYIVQYGTSRSPSCFGAFPAWPGLPRPLNFLTIGQPGSGYFSAPLGGGPRVAAALGLPLTVSSGVCTLCAPAWGLFSDWRSAMLLSQPD